MDVAHLRVELKNERPVELLDLTASLDALGRQYAEFVGAQGYDTPGNVRLYISELKSGSIIATLKDIADQASWVYDHRDVLAAFVANFDDLVRMFVGLSFTLPQKPTRIEAERIAQVMEPVAKDGGAQLILQVTGPDSKIIINNHYGSERARAVQEGVRRYVGAPLPTQDFFEKELLYLQQVRDEVRTRVGDRGIIERFSSKPVKLLFMSEDAKKAVLERTDNPFKLAFIVDGQISRIRGEPALYKIYNVGEVIDRP